SDGSTSPATRPSQELLVTPPGRTSHDTDTDVDPTDAADTDEPEDQAFDEDAEVDDELGTDLSEDESLASDSLEEAAELEEAEAADEDEDEVAVVPPDAEFDDDGEDLVTAVAGEDEGAEEIEGVRDGEFVCRSCFMAKRETQLADPKRLLCRDCV
ncbi:MAG: hypothetical protein ACOCT8_05595, partial [Actinomycetota bacterium]